MKVVENIFEKKTDGGKGWRAKRRQIQTTTPVHGRMSEQEI